MGRKSHLCFVSQLSTCVLCSEQAVKDVFHELQAELVNILDTTTAYQDYDNKEIARKFFDQVPEIYHLLHTNIKAILAGDPTAHTAFEVIRAYLQPLIQRRFERPLMLMKFNSKVIEQVSPIVTCQPSCSFSYHDVKKKAPENRGFQLFRKPD